MYTTYTYFFNDILVDGVFPEMWNRSYKNGCKSDPNNYRGITMCSNLSKVFTGVLLNRLY